MPGYPTGYGGYQPYYQPMPYNPMQNNEQRMQQILQANPQLAAQFPPPQSQPPALKGRPVSGIEEARASQIDLDGSVHVFTDIANGRIYTKQLGLNGSAVFEVYDRQQAAPDAPCTPAQSLAREDVESAIRAATGALAARIEALESQINAIGGAANEPNAVNRPTAKQRKPDVNVATDGG